MTDLAPLPPFETVLGGLRVTLAVWPACKTVSAYVGPLRAHYDLRDGSLAPWPLDEREPEGILRELDRRWFLITAERRGPYHASHGNRLIHGLEPALRAWAVSVLESYQLPTSRTAPLPELFRRLAHRWARFYLGADPPPEWTMDEAFTAALIAKVAHEEA